MQQPYYYAQPNQYGPPPPQPQVVVITDKPKARITNMAQMGSVTFCEFCQSETDNIKLTKAGGVTFAWCFFLLLLSGGILSFVPFCCDDCKDV